MAVLDVNGDHAGLIHRSVLDRIAEIGGRLDCRCAVTLGELPACFGGSSLPRLRRDLSEIIAFADTARQTGWTLGELTAAPGRDPVPVLDTPQGRLWAHRVPGFVLHAEGGEDRITELAGRPGTARRVALARLIAPLAGAAARATVLAVYERHQC